MHKNLNESDYKCIIFHCISHGGNDGDSIQCSDGKKIELDFLRHELNDKDELGAQNIKIIFHHACRGSISNVNIPSLEIDDSQTSIRATVSIDSPINNADVDVSSHSNSLTLYGTIKDWALSDTGKFTKCICKAFRDNVKKKWKDNLNTLITQIGRDLEKATNKTEICEQRGTLRYDHIRFVKCKRKENQLSGNDVEL